MVSYQLWKTLHVTSAVLLVGNVTVTGFWAYFLYRQPGEVGFRAIARGLKGPDHNVSRRFRRRRESSITSVTPAPSQIEPWIAISIYLSSSFPLRRETVPFRLAPVGP